MRSLLVALVGLTAMSAAFAQSPPPRGESGLIDRLAVVLDLDDYQKAQMQELMEAQRDKMEAERAKFDTSGKRPSFEEMRAKHQAMQKEMRGKLSSILTPEQLKKYDAFMPQRGPGPMGPMGGPPPGE